MSCEHGGDLAFAQAAVPPHGLNVHVVLLMPMENCRMIEEVARRSDRGRL
jgi:hypothetical protein